MNIYLSFQNDEKLEKVIMEMEMAILGFRIFLIITSQSYFKSIKLRFCMVEFYLGSDQRIFILNFDDVWKFVLLEDFTPSSMLLVLLIYAFITF